MGKPLFFGDILICKKCGYIHNSEQKECKDCGHKEFWFMEEFPEPNTKCEDWRP